MDGCHIGIVLLVLILTYLVVGKSFCISLSNVDVIGLSAAKLWRYIDFPKWRSQSRKSTPEFRLSDCIHSEMVKICLHTNIGSKSAISLHWEPVDPKFQVEGVAFINHSSFHKTRLNDLSYGIKNLDRSFFRFVTTHAFDRQTDRQTDGQNPYRLTASACSSF